VNQLRREVKESFGSIDARRDRMKFQIEARRWFQERPNFRAFAVIRCSSKQSHWHVRKYISRSSFFGSSNSSCYSFSADSRSFCLKQQCHEHIRDAASTGAAPAIVSKPDTKLSERWRETHSWIGKQFQNPPSGPGHDGLTYIHEESQDNARETVFPGARSLENEFYDAPDARRTTQGRGR